MDFKKICVLGLGYIGLPTACTFATHGVRVCGVDVNTQIVETLRQGGVHIHEPGLRALVQAAIASGNLTIQHSPEPADAYIIAVPTPFYENKQADMRSVISAAESIVPVLQSGNLVVLESTSPPRTTAELLTPILEKSGLKAGCSKEGDGFYLAYSPERVLPGKILRELIENARVVGGVDRESAEAGQDLYSIFVRASIILTDATTAELIKLMENTYRDINIAAANEFSNLAVRFGVDVWEAISIANLHPRVNILYPGPGVGGHCIGVDPWFLVEAAQDLTPLIRTARTVNDHQPQVVVDLISKVLNGVKGKRIAILGLAYKPDVDDLRESPAIQVAERLALAGALVQAFEPSQRTMNDEGFISCPTLEEAVKDADLVALMVGHSSLRAINPGELADKTPARIIVDTVNGWSSKPWSEAGFHLVRLGDGRSQGVGVNG